LLAAWATTDATIKYYNGDSGGFKLGVDLVGGTILVYEIDLRRTLRPRRDSRRFDPVRDINVLAESLKRRIDPNDLYNITIRPPAAKAASRSSSPPAARYRTKKAEAQWDALLKEVKAQFVPDYKGELEVGRGKVLELADKVQSIQSEELWEKKLFSSPDGWERFKKSAFSIGQNRPGNQGRPEPQQGAGVEINAIRSATSTASPTSCSTPCQDRGGHHQEDVQNWIKKQAWDETMTQVRREWFPVKAWDEATDYPTVASRWSAR